MQAVQHLRNEGEGEAVLYCDGIEGAVVHHKAELAIWAFYKHHWSGCGRLRGPDEAIRQVTLDVGLHGDQLDCRHAVDGSPRGLCIGQEGNLEVVFAVGRERVGLLLRKHVQIVMVSRGNLLEKTGIGRGGGRLWKGSSKKRERGGRKRWGRGVRCGSGGKEGRRGGGRGQASGRAEGRGKRKDAGRPVDAGVVALQPGKPEHQLEVAQPGHLEGKGLGMTAMNA